MTYLEKIKNQLHIVALLKKEKQEIVKSQKYEEAANVRQQEKDDYKVVYDILDELINARKLINEIENITEQLHADSFTYLTIEKQISVIELIELGQMTEKKRNELLDI